MGARRGWVAVAAIALVALVVIGGHLLDRATGGSPSSGPPSGAEAPRSVADPAAVAAGEPAAGAVAAVERLRLAPPFHAAPRTGPHGSFPLTGSSAVALTFDDGPDPRWTPMVLDLLRRYEIRATFCLIGLQVAQFPHLVRRIAYDGHTLCNHSWGHEIGLGGWTAADIRTNLRRTNDEIRRVVPGVAIPYFRHPGGNWTPRAVAVAAELGMASVHWDVDTQDWRRPGPGAIAHTVGQRTRPGSIVLLHDGGGDRSGTVAACQLFLPNLSNRFALVALPKSVRHLGGWRYELD